MSLTVLMKGVGFISGEVASVSLKSKDKGNRNLHLEKEILNLLLISELNCILNHGTD